MLVGEDVGTMGGVFRATEGLLEAFGPERVVDTPLSESGIVGVAIGMSLNGLRPVVEIQFADFIHSAWDQLISEAAKMRYRSNEGWSCPMVVRVPYGAGVHGGLYHSQSIEAILCHVPGLKVLAPSTSYDAKGLLKSAIRDEDPVLRILLVQRTPQAVHIAESGLHLQEDARLEVLQGFVRPPQVAPDAAA